MAPTFIDLPVEILESIFIHLDATSLISVSLTSRTVNDFTSNVPVVWRSFCKTHFRTWASHHHIAAKFAGPLSDVDWRALFVQRVRTNKETNRLFELVLSSQLSRIQHMNEIANFGSDAWESLYEQSVCSRSMPDVLAREYYAKAIMGMIQRESAIKLWKRLDQGEDISLETALGAYDVFTSISSLVDWESIDRDINRLAGELLENHPTFATASARVKASILAGFLHTKGFRGVSDASYRALRNSFIGYALHNPPHQSLPLISVAIFCALAKRLGLDARPCGFVFHVYCIVYAPKDYDLNGLYKPTSSSELHSMYLDPFRSSDEVPSADLQRVLRQMGVPSAEHTTFLSDTTTREMVLRTARNIMNSVQTIRQGNTSIDDGIAWANSSPDIDTAFYATIWSMMILSPSTATSGPANTLISTTPRRGQYLPYLLDHMQIHQPWDVSLLERHVVPYFANSNNREGAQLEKFARTIRTNDRLAKPVKSRVSHDPTDEVVYYQIGQLIKHVRYQYEGVIIGWDTSCEQDEEWIQVMQVDTLSAGRNQAFYHILASDKSLRYVADQNIIPTGATSEPTNAMLKLAGRYFKRWDRSTGCFVSNIRDEYPED
ncbi:unnamed protein product [Periconia digitata]|uniref:F-box domain-containing protein n=1 Tax=Periconia digitata TaxID=1303443 RepID=A0A9W4XPH4_9PLEO|nr:unnamed protein product [Periconia digitata]